MSKKFERQACQNCGLKRDATMEYCPRCEVTEENLLKHNNPLEHLDWVKCVLMMVVLFAAMALIMMVCMIAYGIANPDLLNDLEDIPGLSTWSSAVGSLGAIIVGGFILKDYLKPLFKTAKNYKNFLFGFLAGVVLVLVNMLLETVLSIEDNANQALLMEEVKHLPIIFIIGTGIITPIFEELVFRVGMYGFFRRFGKPVAYIVSTILFALIHIDFAAANLTTELISIPFYIIPGFALAFIYDKFGLWGSITLHATNNLSASIVAVIALV